jgi:WD40 repeat protein
LADRHDQHNVYLFDVASGAGKSQPGDTNKIFDISFSAISGDNSFATAGVKHIKFWNSSLGSKKGIFGKFDMTSFACVAWDASKTCYTGGANGNIYVWGNGGNEATNSVKAHDGGFVSALRWIGGFLYSGGKDGTVKMWDSQMNLLHTRNFGGVLVRSIDVYGMNALVGMKDGTIYCYDKNGKG